MIATALAALVFAPPLTNAHSHNDYTRSRPLEEALEQGFCSLEADIFLEDGELRVGHDREDLRPGVTLERMYLDPLWQRFRENSGWIHGAPGVEVILLVDIKAEGARVWQVLRPQLEKRKAMLATGDYGSGAVRVVISGDRPIATLLADEDHLAGVDGRLPDLRGPQYSYAQMPMVSASWLGEFTWLGRGEIPELQAARLRSLARQAKMRGQVLRFWATPDLPAMWGTLRDAGVGLINTDRPADLAAFLREP